MGLLRSFAVDKRASPENPQTSLDKPATWLTKLFGDSSVAGIQVTPENAVSATTVYACIRLVSETIASLPLVLYKTDGKSKEKAVDHPLYWLLHNEPNRTQNSFQWLETEQARLFLWGNSYNEIERNNKNEVLALWSVHPDVIEPKIEAQYKYYDLQMKSGGLHRYPDNQILHVAGFGFDGLKGISPIRTNKAAIGLSLAAAKFMETLFTNGVRPSGVLQHPGRLTEKSLSNLRQSFLETYSGVGNNAKPMVLEEDMKWQSIGLSPHDAEILETMKFMTTEVARMFNVPPHMIGDLERSTNNNIEQQSLEFVVYCLRTWLVRWERELNRKLLQPFERGRYYFKFIVDGLLRGDTKSRFEAYNLGRNMGLYCSNDIREKEDLNPVEHGDNDFMIPLNMGLASNVGGNNDSGGNNGQ